MNKYHDRKDIGLATLYLADSRAVDLEIDNFAIITDPVWPNVPEDMFDLDCSPTQLLADVLNRFTQASRSVIILRFDSDPRFLTSVPGIWPFFRICHLPYAFPAFVGRKLAGSEYAYIFGQPIKSAPGQRVIPGESKKAQPGGTDRRHPCARHIDHMRWLVSWHSENEETILDPFMGSGTIGVAAVEMGRRFVGIEKEPAYFEIACERITQAQQQLKLAGVRL